MKSIYHIISAGALAAVLIASNVQAGYAQFSQAVVVLKGTIRTEDSAKPPMVKVSVRMAGDTAREISEVTSSHSNSETGKYLVVLKPGKKYWVHLEGNTIMPKDIMVETPSGDQTQQIQKDFTVVAREADAIRMPLQQNN